MHKLNTLTSDCMIMDGKLCLSFPNSKFLIAMFSGFVESHEEYKYKSIYNCKWK